jgi:hypothetical protein
MPRHTPILMSEAFQSPPIVLHSTARKRRRSVLFRWAALFLGGLTFLVG